MTVLNQMESSMKSNAIVSAIMVMSLPTAGFYFAQGSGVDRALCDREQSRAGQRGRRHAQARQPNRPQNQGRAHNKARPDERGAGPDHAFRRGQRLPMEYRNRQYVVDDWRGHHLSAPPRGYHWVQTGGDYVLVAIATGVILQLLLNN